MSADTPTPRRVTRTTETFGPCWQCGGSGGGYSVNDPNSTVASQWVTCQRCCGTGQITVARTAAAAARSSERSRQADVLIRLLEGAAQ